MSINIKKNFSMGFSIEKIYIIIYLLISLNACAILPNHNVLNEYSYTNDFNHIDHKKIIYSQEIRGVKYDGKPLLTETGEKVRNIDDAIKRLDYYPAKISEVSVGEIIEDGVITVFVAPPAILVSCLWTIIEFPLLPVEYYAVRKSEKKIKSHYENGKLQLKLKNYDKARLYFFRAISLGKKIVQESDIYYWIAKTYEEEGENEKAKEYFQLFLRYSIRLYPEYFLKYDKSFVNDYEKLKTLFDESDMKISAFK